MIVPLAYSDGNGPVICMPPPCARLHCRAGRHSTRAAAAPQGRAAPQKPAYSGTRAQRGAMAAIVLITAPRRLAGLAAACAARAGLISRLARPRACRPGGAAPLAARVRRRRGLARLRPHRAADATPSGAPGARHALWMLLNVAGLDYQGLCRRPLDELLTVARCTSSGHRQLHARWRCATRQTLRIVNVPALPPFTHAGKRLCRPSCLVDLSRALHVELRRATHRDGGVPAAMPPRGAPSPHEAGPLGRLTATPVNRSPRTVAWRCARPSMCPLLNRAIRARPSRVDWRLRDRRR